jgi:hypothetical protein
MNAGIAFRVELLGDARQSFTVSACEETRGAAHTALVSALFVARLKQHRL